jgi:DNA-binding transcriptional ArsR family regulator
MMIEIKLQRTFRDKLSFTYSPLHECLMSLHVLSNPKHHPAHLKWATETKRRLPGPLAATLRALGQGFREFLMLAGVVEVDPDVDFQTCDDELARTETMTPETFAVRTMRSLADREATLRALASASDRDKLIARIDLHMDAERSAISELLSDPARVQARLLAALRAYWELAFAAKFAEIEALLIRDITEKGWQLEREGPVSLVCSLSDYVSYNSARNSLVIHDGVEVSLDMEQMQAFSVGPSYYVSPHLVVDVEPTHLVLYYNILASDPSARPAIAPEALRVVLKALSNETRLNILRLLAEGTCSTQELAQRLHFTEPTISHHLSVLKQARLTQGHNEGYYILYGLVSDPLLTLSRDLGRYLGLAQAIHPDGFPPRPPA